VAAVELPELAAVPWRARLSETRLRQRERVWMASTAAHVAPFVGTALLLAALEPALIPVSVIALVFAWAIPELYAARGANVLRAPRGLAGSAAAEHRALGLLGDLVDHTARERLRDTGFVVEPAGLGVWVIGQAGAVLVRPGGRRAHCMCVRVAESDLPPADRIAHLLLALRADEAGFATVANLAFAGAPWRLCRRLARPARAAVRVACDDARAAGAAGRGADAI
jgi:hypothetical protein